MRHTPKIKTMAAVNEIGEYTILTWDKKQKTFVRQLSTLTTIDPKLPIITESVKHLPDELDIAMLKLDEIMRTI